MNACTSKYFPKIITLLPLLQESQWDYVIKMDKILTLSYAFFELLPNMTVYCFCPISRLNNFLHG